MKKLSQLFIALAVLTLTGIVPLTVVAQKNTNTVKAPTNTVKPPTNSGNSGSSTCAELREKFENAGGSEVIEGVPEYCSVESVYAKFINAALFAIGIAAVIAIVYGGYLYMTARGNETQVKKGRQVLTWAIIGFILVMAAATIVNIIVSTLVDNRFV